jgi:protein SCO1/2
VVLRVSSADARPFAASTVERLASQLTRVADTVPDMALADQHGNVVRLREFRGRPVLVTFLYAHCQTVCPLMVTDLLEVQQRIREDLPLATPGGDAAALAATVPEVVIVTLDPLRDTPSRLPSIAAQWKLGAGAHVVSGPVDDVERVLSAWRVPRVRNAATGEVSHPTMVYVIGGDGLIHYVTPGGADIIAAAVRAQ